MHLLQRSEYSLRESIVAGTGKVQLEWNIEYLFWALLSSRCYSCWTSAAAPVPVAVHYEEIGKQFVRVARAIIMDTALPLKMVTVEHFTKGKIRTEVKAILKRRVDFLMFKLIIGKLLKKKRALSLYHRTCLSLSLSRTCARKYVFVHLCQCAIIRCVLLFRLGFCSESAFSAVLLVRRSLRDAL